MFAAPHNLLAFGGSLFSGLEEWSCTLRSTTTGTDDDAGATAALAAIGDVVSLWVQGNPIMGAQARLGWLKFNRVGVDGKYLSNTTRLREFTPERVNASGGGNYPAQIALVATLETGAQRGLAHRGRIFLPCPRFGIGVDGRITAEDAQTAATSVATLLGNLNSATGYGSTIVASRTRSGDQRVVTGVTVGRVLDTMRSRRTSLPEERTPVTPVTGF